MGDQKEETMEEMTKGLGEAGEHYSRLASFISMKVSLNRAKFKEKLEKKVDDNSSVVNALKKDMEEMKEESLR